MAVSATARGRGRTDRWFSFTRAVLQTELATFARCCGTGARRRRPVASRPAQAQILFDSSLAHLPEPPPLRCSGWYCPLAMKGRLFSMPGSHAATTGQLLFDHKGIDYKRTDLLPVVSWVVLKALGFPELTVPAAKIDGELVQGTRAIARELERRKPELSLLRSEDGSLRRPSALATRSSSNGSERSSSGPRAMTAADSSAASRAQRSGCRIESLRGPQVPL